MIVINKAEGKWHNTTFNDANLITRFRKKYTDWDFKIVVQHGNGIWVDVMKDPVHAVTKLVNDWGGSLCSCTLANEKLGIKVSFSFRQPYILCSSVELSPPSILVSPMADLVHEFLYLMGYTNIFISVRESSTCYQYKDALEPILEKDGYISYMKLNNRRTGNNITLYTKTLK